MSKNILIVAAHSDDEALGCGGTLARHVAEGDRVFAIFLADGVSSRQADEVDSRLSQREQAAADAHSILGISNVSYLGFPDNRLDMVALLDIVQPLEKLIAEIKPEIVYTHHYGDLNVDHRVTHQAVMTACRPLPDHSVKEIYSFEVLSSTEWNTPAKDPFLPNVFVDISKYMDVKLSALEAYRMEMREPPHSRSLEHIKSLARHRGYSVGVEAAEALLLIRSLR